jgi:MFS family permease
MTLKEDMSETEPAAALLATDAAPVLASAQNEGKWCSGTLRYTVTGLAVLFCWLLWGDFCFTVFESIFSKFLPLYMNDLKASNTLIGVMTGSIAGVLNILFLPGISIWSDRYRGRWGRRIPFLLWAMPCTVASLILIGFAPEIGDWLFSKVGHSLGITQAALILGILGVVVASYSFFNMVLVNIYQCLLRDVVPLELMARFLALFRTVGTAAGFLFFYSLFPYLITYRKLLCISVGVVCVISFLLMCFGVREGEYPPPPPKPARDGISSYFRDYFRTLYVYFRDCLSVDIYRNYLIMYAMVTAASTCASPFVVLFARETLGLSMDDMGKVYAWAMLPPLVLNIPFGYVCEKFSPLRVVIASLAGFTAVSAYVFFAGHDLKTWFIYAVVLCALPNVAWGLAQTATTMVLFPVQKFAQLSSSINVLGYGSVVLGSWLAGRYIDLFGGNYRMIFLWSLFWFAAALVPMFLVYRGWKRRGGLQGYIPPLPGEN